MVEDWRVESRPFETPETSAYLQGRQSCLLSRTLSQFHACVCPPVAGAPKVLEAAGGVDDLRQWFDYRIRWMANSLFPVFTFRIASILKQIKSAVHVLPHRMFGRTQDKSGQNNTTTENHSCLFYVESPGNLKLDLPASLFATPPHLRLPRAPVQVF